MAKKVNREKQLKTEKQFTSHGIRLYDIDEAIVVHLETVVIPTLESSGEPLKVPVLYGSAQRWKSIQKDGVFRDNLDQLQLPLVVIKRNSVERNDNLASRHNKHVSYPSFVKYSKKHKYDLFSKLTGTVRPAEHYNVTLPDYVNVSYEGIVWTDTTIQMNEIIESIQFAVDEYWGTDSGFRFNVEVDSFDTTAEIGDGTKRIVKSTFSMTVQAYLLPAKFNNEPTTKKSLTVKKVVWNKDNLL